ncbi:LPXTG cell wall anchor domain-containing protein [Streptomyces sp. NPDC058657]|uniref:LPXTG cell wall anchor domain-containing protein n=1 Tax=unclassified Streptomyces TaxID=2593676 RepID=UPI0036482737
MLATAVAAAVTTPVLFLSAGTAFAAGPAPAAQAQDQKAKPTPAELEALEKAAADAKKAYDEAVAAQVAATQAVDEVMSDDTPAAVKAAEAQKTADAASAAKKAADKALADANAALLALPEGADTTAAEKAVADAEKDVVAKGAAKTEADEALKAAYKVRDDARVDALRKLGSANAALDNAKVSKDAADKALKAAQDEAAKPDPTKPPVDPTKPPIDPTKPPVDPTVPPVDPTVPPVDDECRMDEALSTTLNGLPSKVVAGTTVDFTLRVTNGTGKEIDEVKPFATVYGNASSHYDDISKLLRLQSAPAGSNAFKDVKEAQYAGTVTHLKAGASADLKMRLIVDKKAPAAEGIAFVAGDYWNDNGSCGSNDLKEYGFEILAAGSKPGKVEDSTPTEVKDATRVPVPQGGAGTTPVGTGTGGSLAATGSSGTPQLGLAAGATVLLGAGAVFVARRRKAGARG